MKPKCAHLVLVTAALLIPSGAFAQLIKGTVRDAETKDIVRNSFVALIDTGASIVYGTSVDQRGRFSLKVSQLGTFAVYAIKAGYVRQVSQWMGLESAADTFVVAVWLSRTSNTLPAQVIEAQRDSIRGLSVLGMSLKSLGGTIVAPAEVEMASQTAASAYDVVESLHLPALSLKTIVVSSGAGGSGRGLLNGVYRCIAYRRTNGCVTVVVNGQRFSDLGDLLQLESLLGARDISHMVFLRPNEAGTLFGSETTNGVLLIFRTGQR